MTEYEQDETPNELVIADAHEFVALSPMDQARDFILKGGSVESLNAVLHLQKEFEANEAKKAYYRAMVKFKRCSPEIYKDRQVNAGGGGRYNHASLGNAANKINIALAEYGLTGSWTTKQDGDIATVTYRLTHMSGHSEETSMSARPDFDKTSMNNIQKFGAVVSYLERYTLFALTGLAPTDVDNDAQPIIDEYISTEDTKKILSGLESATIDLPAFLKFMGCETLEKMTKSSLPKAHNLIEQKLKAIKK